MSVKIFPSALEGEPIEVHETSGRMSIRDWLSSNVRGFNSHEGGHPIIVFLGSEQISSDDWGLVYFSENDDVRIYPVAKGAILVAVLVAAVIGFILGQFLKPDRPKAQQQGRTLDDTGVQANASRLGEPILEVAGSPWVYPDYLMPPRSIYLDYREKWTYLFLCLGKGYYSKSITDVRIGDTPAIMLGDSVEVKFYEPGQNVTAVDPDSPIFIAMSVYYDYMIYYSEDQGATWQESTLPESYTNTDMRSIFAHDRIHNTIVCVGTEYDTDPEDEGVAIVSGDSGKTWQRVAIPGMSDDTGDYQLYDVVYNSKFGTLIALGKEGRYSLSTDGGLTWTNAKVLPLAPDTSNLDYPDNITYHPQTGNTIVTIGQFEYTVSKDGGRTWTACVAMPLASNFQLGYNNPGMVGVSQDGTIVAIGERDYDEILLTVSKDGGIRWSPIKAVQLPPDDVLPWTYTGTKPVLDEVNGALIFPMWYRHLMITRDNGASFELVRPFPPEVEYDDLGLFLTTQAGKTTVIFGRYGIATSYDGFKTWTTQVLDQGLYFDGGTHVFESLAAAPAEWWHEVKEVGATNFGNSGFTLGSTDIAEINWTGSFTVSGTLIDGGFPVPGSWDNGMIVMFATTNQVEFLSATEVRSVELDSYTLSVGDAIVLSGPTNGGAFTIGSIDSTDPNSLIYTLTGASFTTGTYAMSAKPSGVNFVIISKTGNLLEVSPDDFTPWSGFPSGTSTSGGVTLSPESIETGWSGPFPAVPEGELCDRFEVDIFFPQGLIEYNSSGDPKLRSATMILQWRYGGGSWNEETVTKTLSTPDQIGYTHRVILPEPGEIEVRLKANKAPSQDTQIRETQQWTALRGRIIGYPETYPQMTTMSIRVRTGDKLSSNVENKIRVQPTRMLPSVSNANQMVATRDIVPFLLYMFDTVGYSRDMVDMQRLEDYHAIWSQNQDYFDLAINTSSTMKVIANHALNAGFAELTLRRGRISAARDSEVPGGLPTRVYSPQQYTAPLIESTQCVLLDDIDGVDVEFLDRNSNISRTLKFRLEGDLGLRVETLKVPGVTSEAKALALAERRRRMLAFRRTEFEGSTELHMLNSEYMDLVGLQDGIPEYGQSSRILSYDGTTVRIAEPIIQYDEPMVACMIRMDGTSTEPVAIIGFPDHYTMELASLPFVPHLGGDGRDPTVILFGRLGMWCHLARITSIQPLEDGKVKFKAVNYDPRQYLLNG